MPATKISQSGELLLIKGKEVNWAEPAYTINVISAEKLSPKADFIIAMPVTNPQIPVAIKGAAVSFKPRLK